ncbi:MAG: putative Mg2+ transporter-C (MgtC) family protein [Acidimicrobiaceae bacterium]|jgi:putative Mg2+ transporter-C (MgtC) family protein|nr:putative Mg2+ transporter-C (MgtC) family protein [Acidimicrobiaceae bacterium]
MRFPSETELILRILLAALLGGLIGLEREIAGHPAGLRTHISVALGAALFGVLSAYGFNHFDVPRNDTVFQVDVTRIASQIVVGVGFLGGGAILKEGATVRGLTTAASLWVTAAIGLAVALGSFGPALATEGALLGTFVLLRFPRKWIRSNVAKRRQSIVIILHPGTEAGTVIGAISSLSGVTVRSLQVRDTTNGPEITADLVARPGVDLEKSLTSVGDRDDVVSLDIA